MNCSCNGEGCDLCIKEYSLAEILQGVVSEDVGLFDDERSVVEVGGNTICSTDPRVYMSHFLEKYVGRNVRIVIFIEDE